MFNDISDKNKFWGCAERVRDTFAVYIWWLQTSIISRLGFKYSDEKHSQKHLALLAWLFPPYISGGVYRPASLAKYGTALGWKISIITKSFEGLVSDAGEYLMRLLPHELNIGYIIPPQIKPSFKLSLKVDGSFINALATFSLAKKLFVQNPPAVVVATGPPFHNYIAAYYISRFYKSKMILDYRDEWTECPFDFVHAGKFDRYWEKVCLSSADAVFFTTQSQLIHQTTVFSCLNKRKCHVIPNGWEPLDFYSTGLESKDDGSISANDYAFISHFGMLGHTLPGEFLSTLEGVLKGNPQFKKLLRIQFVGKKSYKAIEQLSKFSFPEILDVRDHLQKSIANSMMKKTSALLLLYDKRFTRYLPGKLYDYLAAGPPIIIFGENGEAVDLVKDLNAGYFVRTNDAVCLEKVLGNIISRGTETRDKAKINKWLEFHTREKMAQRMIDIIEGMIGQE